MTVLREINWSFLVSYWLMTSHIEYEIIGEGSQISTNQKRESTVSWLLIGQNLRPFPDNFVLYNSRPILALYYCAIDIIVILIYQYDYDINSTIIQS